MLGLLQYYICFSWESRMAIWNACHASLQMELVLFWD